MLQTTMIYCRGNKSIYGALPPSEPLSSLSLNSKIREYYSRILGNVLDKEK